MVGTAWKQDFPKQNTQPLPLDDIRDEIDFSTTTEYDPEHKMFDFDEFGSSGYQGSGMWSVDGDTLTVIYNIEKVEGFLDIPKDKLIMIHDKVVIKGNKLIIKNIDPNGTITTYTKI